MLAKEIIQLNFVTFIAIIFCMISIIKNKSMDKRINQLYMTSSILIAILMVAGSFDFYFESLEELNYFRYVSSSIGYVLRPVGLLLLIYTLVRYNKTSKMSWIIISPAIINAVFCFLNLVTHWMFYFTSDNQFVRGPLSFLPFVVSGLYLILLTYTAIINSSFIEKMEIALVIVTSIAIVIAVALESIWGFRCILNGVAILSANCYYLYLNTLTYRRDELTNLLNRRSFYEDIKKLSGKYFVVCIDINDLKTINDVHGHQEGDKAIKQIAKALIDFSYKSDKIYRVGGDEFAILTKSNESHLSTVFTKINESIAQEGLSVAYGYEMFGSAKEFDKIYTMADKKMYDCKAQMKNEMLLRK